MFRPTRIRGACLIALVGALCGCDLPSLDPGASRRTFESEWDGVWRRRGPYPLLSPFAGDWAYDIDGTLAVLEKAGTPKEETDLIRKLHDEAPQVTQGELRFEGNVATALGKRPEEYRFFSMHQHDGYICGKAWHHEDRFDYGDMSKCHVRLRIQNGLLEMRVRSLDGIADPDDRDLLVDPPTEGGAAETCEAEHPTEDEWSDWMIVVFRRKN